ncbi:hypothetical protein [Silvibacterium sp.]|uniref:hypothetical protein n=1 Tax=Silvibacterium sp. TaxID=1964179 RepID=UPI0039E56687
MPRLARSWKLSAFLLLPALCAGTPLVRAQQAGTPPALDAILNRLEANLHHYDAGVPSLFCDEHVVSSQSVRDTPIENSVTDSIFRLRRTPGPGGTTSLVESREIKTVDGKRPQSKDMDGPTLLSGMFEGGLAVVSRSQAACMKYTLEKPDKKQPGGPYVVRFETELAPQNLNSCFLTEKSKGLVDIDPASMQVTHLEITTPRHVISAGGDFAPRMIGKRELAVDYAPVPLGDSTFWLPSAIGMTTGTGFASHDKVWSFQAEYRNCHRLEVTTRMLPAGPAQ